MELSKVKSTPKDRTITYSHIVVNYRSQKNKTNRVRITSWGNLITYPGDITTGTADLKKSSFYGTVC